MRAERRGQARAIVRPSCQVARGAVSCGRNRKICRFRPNPPQRSVGTQPASSRRASPARDRADPPATIRSGRPPATRRGRSAPPGPRGHVPQPRSVGMRERRTEIGHLPAQLGDVNLEVGDPAHRALTRASRGHRRRRVSMPGAAGGTIGRRGRVPCHASDRDPMLPPACGLRSGPPQAYRVWPTRRRLRARASAHPLGTAYGISFDISVQVVGAFAICAGVAAPGRIRRDVRSRP